MKLSAYLFKTVVNIGKNINTAYGFYILLFCLPFSAWAQFNIHGRVHFDDGSFRLVEEDQKGYLQRMQRVALDWESESLLKEDWYGMRYPFTTLQEKERFLKRMGGKYLLQRIKEHYLQGSSLEKRVSKVKGKKVADSLSRRRVVSKWRFKPLRGLVQFTLRGNYWNFAAVARANGNLQAILERFYSRAQVHTQLVADLNNNLIFFRVTKNLSKNMGASFYAENSLSSLARNKVEFSYHFLF